MHTSSRHSHHWQHYFTERCLELLNSLNNTNVYVREGFPMCLSGCFWLVFGVMHSDHGENRNICYAFLIFVFKLNHNQKYHFF